MIRPWQWYTQRWNSLISRITCTAPRTALRGSTPNYSSTFSSVLLFSSSPATGLWSFFFVVSHIRHAQNSSLSTSYSAGVYCKYCRKTYSVRLLSVWRFAWNSGCTFAIPSTDASSCYFAVASPFTHDLYALLFPYMHWALQHYMPSNYLILQLKRPATGVCALRMRTYIHI